MFDAQRRFNPQFEPGTEAVIPCDTVILAIGQASDLSFLTPEDGIETTRQGTVKIDPETLMTTAPGIFAAGDIAFGPRLIINAVADGKKAAEQIDRYLQGPAWTPKPRYVQITILDHHQMAERYDEYSRLAVPILPTRAAYRNRGGGDRVHRSSRRAAKPRVACNAGSIRSLKVTRRKARNASCAADAWMFARRTA